MAPKIGFTRWYDSLPELSQAVRLLERANPDHRDIICKFVVDMYEEHCTPNPHEDYGLKKLGAQKVIGLMKSKSKRRWYDQEPQVHKAFNALYVMDESMRYEAAIRILICLEALKQHDKQLLNNMGESLSQEPQSNKRTLDMSQRNIVKSIFYQQTQVLLKKIQFVRPEKAVSQTLPGFEPPATKPADLPKEAIINADHIIDDNSGMKLGGLQLPKVPNGLI